MLSTNRQQVIRFRRLSHKAYAVFASMHREVTIGCLSPRLCDRELLKAGKGILIAAAMTSGVVLADATPPGETPPDSVAQQLSIPEVLVSAQKTEVNASAYRLVCTISRAEIEALPIATVADILKYLPGVDVRTRGGNGGQADVSIRGGTFDQVQVLINGINLTDSHTGHYSLNLPLSTLLITRIEVLQSTTAQVFGLNAFAGAINIITKEETEDEKKPIRFIGKVSGGMNGYVHPEGVIRANSKGWYVHSSVEYSHADGYLTPSPSEKEQTAAKNSDHRIANIYLQTGRQDLDIQVGAQYKDIGAGMFYGFGSQDQFDATRTAFGAVQYAHRWGAWSMDVQASYRANYDRYEWHRGQRQYGNFHFTQNAAGAIRAHYASRIGITSIGLELRNENIHSTNLGDTIHPNGQVPNVEGFEIKDVRVLDLVYGDNRLHTNYFAEQVFRHQNLSAGVGMSGNYTCRFGHNMAGEANIGYLFAPQGRVYMNAHRAIRLPTFTDLYYNAGNQLGNRNLRPETAWTLSIGSEYSHSFAHQQGSLSARGNLYHRWGKDIIDWVYIPEDTRRPYHATNQQEVNTLGIEADLSYRWGEWLPYVGISYAYTHMDLNLQETGSRYLDYLKHHLTLRVEHAIWVDITHKWKIGGNWALSYREREGQYNNAEGVVCDYQPTLLLDGSVYWKNEKVCVTAECTNITHQHYYDYGGVLQPGAWLKGSIMVQL